MYSSIINQVEKPKHLYTHIHYTVPCVPLITSIVPYRLLTYKHIPAEAEENKKCLKHCIYWLLAAAKATRIEVELSDILTLVQYTSLSSKHSPNSTQNIYKSTSALMDILDIYPQIEIIYCQHNVLVGTKCE